MLDLRPPSDDAIPQEMKNLYAQRTALHKVDLRDAEAVRAVVSADCVETSNFLSFCALTMCELIV